VPLFLNENWILLSPCRYTDVLISPEGKNNKSRTHFPAYFSGLKIFLKGLIKTFCIVGILSFLLQSRCENNILITLFKYYAF